MPAVAGSRSRADMMISVRPPLSSVIDRSASTFRRELDDDLPGKLDGRGEPDELEEPDEPEEVAGGGVRAPGNADGVGPDFGGVDAAPDCGALA